ncbi:MAG: molecular chaperone DnaJ [Candidatus Gastranaerophilales bacterium]|nr:molecular chaperone DnaJ [Candidatus Gastranaerophilales bacterium]
MDYYEILGVEKNATKDEIKSAFRKKARQLHPDVNKAPDAEEKFKELGKAYETLSDDEKRELYDRYGEDGLKSAGYSQGGPFEFGFGGLNDIFEAFFGGGGGFSSRHNPNAPMDGDDLRMDIQIDFMEAIFGAEKEIKISHLEECMECMGTGKDKNAKNVSCRTCNGQGRVQQNTRTILGNFTSVTTCPSCNGTGVDPSATCKICKGRGAVKKEKTVKIKIPKGVDTGSRIRYSHEGNAGKNGGEAGDLYFVLYVKESKDFIRDGVDIHTILEISMPQAVLGDEVIIDTIDGKEKITVPKGTDDLEKILIKGRGVPYLGKEGQRGNHYVTIKIKTPKKLSKEEEKLYQQLFDLSKNSAPESIMDRVKTAFK